MGASAEAFSPTVLTPALVSALSVYAVGRKSFHALTRCEVEADKAKALIFARLRLDEFGWSHSETTITPAGRDDSAFPIWRLSRL